MPDLSPRLPRSPDRSPLLFLHVPKTAGSTLSEYLYGHPYFLSDGAPALPSERFYNYGVYHYPGGFYKDPPGHVPGYLADLSRLRDLKAVFGHFSYGLHELTASGGRYVTILRDPVERLLSLYSHLHQLEILREDIDLVTFVLDCPTDGWLAQLKEWDPGPVRPGEDDVRRASRAIVDNDQVRRISGVEPAFGECTQDMLDTAMAHLRDDFSVVGTTERFDETLLLIDRLLGPSPGPPYLPKLKNRSRRSSDSLTDAELGAIRDRNALDVELYRFASELLDERAAAAGSDFAADLANFRTEKEAHVRMHSEAIASRSIW